MVADGEQPVSFGNLLRQHRLRAGLTQEALAERAGVSLRAVQGLERSAGQPQRDTARRLAEALALTAEQRALFERAGAPAPRTRAVSGRRGPRPAGNHGPQDRRAGGPAAPPDCDSGEYKRVTILVADVVGLTDSAQDFEPDLADRLLTEIIPRLADVVHPYDGTVNHGGDGVMALFGAPVAREDDAVRACYAALALHSTFRRLADRIAEELGVTLALRVGLDSGEVVVRTASSNLYREYSVLGPAVRLAARLGQLAEDGTTLLTPETARLADGQVRVRPVGPVPVGGLPEPLQAFELTGPGQAGTRFRRIVATRQLTQFVGRDAELQALMGALERAGAGRGQIVALVGEPGVGKSRLVWELTHSPGVDGWLVLEGGATAAVYSDAGRGRATSYLPIVDLLKSYCRIEARDDEITIRKKVGDRILAFDEGLRHTLPPLLALLDVPSGDAAWDVLDAAQRRRQTLDALKHLLLRESREQPLLLVFEDLHWIDAETQALLDSLADGLPTARILLLVNYRPEYTHGWGSKTYYTQLRVDPLGRQSTDELLTGLLGDDATLDPLRRLLTERTEGNPLFLEESVRSLIETGQLVGGRGAYRLDQPIRELRIPATVQAVLAARIDRLPPEQKRLLQTAAVIGKDVPVGLLQAIAERSEEDVQRGLAALQAVELLYEASLFPDLEYTFKHALTHEVAYRGLIQDRRRELHARIVRAIERLYPDRLAEHVERLAHHAVRGELREQAVHYLRQAGLKSAARSALPEARTWLEQALGILGTLPECRSNLEQAFEILLELRPVLTQLGEPSRALERLREAEAVAEKLSDDRRRGRVYSFMTNAQFLLGELGDALATGTRALEIAGRLGDLRLRIPATTYLVMAHYLRGEYERVVELATDNIAALPADWVSERFGLTAPASVFDRAYLVMSLAKLGRFAGAAEFAAEAIRLAEPTRHAFTVAVAYRAAAMLHLIQGDWARARPLIEHEIAVIRKGDVVLLLPSAVASSAWVLSQLGEATEAMTRLREGEQLNDRLAARGALSQAAWAYHGLGRAGLMLGRLDEARRVADRAVEFSSQHRGFAAYVHHLLGDIATCPERFAAERGEDHYRAALALAEPRGMRPLVAQCHLGLGKLYRRTGRPADARAELSTAVTMLPEMGMAHWLPEAESELASLA